jgi:hypothetical protein
VPALRENIELSYLTVELKSLGKYDLQF